MTRAELLQFDGIGRNVLERRIAALVRVFDAATELSAAADRQVNGSGTTEEDERYEQAWEQLRSVLKAV